MERSPPNGLRYGVIVHATIVVANNMQRIAMEVNWERDGGHNDGGNNFFCGEDETINTHHLGPFLRMTWLKERSWMLEVRRKLFPQRVGTHTNPFKDNTVHPSH